MLVYALDIFREVEGDVGSHLKDRGLLLSLARSLFGEVAEVHVGAIVNIRGKLTVEVWVLGSRLLASFIISDMLKEEALEGWAELRWEIERERSRFSRVDLKGSPELIESIVREAWRVGCECYEHRVEGGRNVERYVSSLNVDPWEAVVVAWEGENARIIVSCYEAVWRILGSRSSHS